MILSNVTLPSGISADICIENGVITEIGKTQGKGIDCSGLVCLPGLVDLHTHLREPGYETSETILSGSRAAAMGGYTAVFAMANTHPVTDTAEVAAQVRDLGLRAGYASVNPIGAITRGLLGDEVTDFAQMTSMAGVRIFSDDGNCVAKTDVMREAMIRAANASAVLAQHAQEPSMTVDAQMNSSALSVELGLKGWPAEAEASIIKRDAELALETGAHLHVCHITTAEGLEVVRWAKSKGANITAEVTPHHLLLTEELVRSYNPVFKVNPPLRNSEDVQTLRSGLIDGTIDVLATDHAPHSSEKKDCEWHRAANGMIGLEAAASVLQLVLISSGAGTWEDFARIASVKPAEIGALVDHGQIRVGKPANLTLIDPQASRRISNQSESLSRNNPWVDNELPGRVIHTVFNGKFTVKEGAIVD